MRGPNAWAACAVLLLASAVLPRGAAAQWDAGASQQLGMGHGFTALSQSTMRNAMQTEEDGEADADARAAEAADTLARGARLDALAREYAERRTRVVPPLLSWRSDAADGARTDMYLLGLGRDARATDGARSGHFIPFYAYGENHFISPLYAHIGSETRTHDVLPPLLSWRSRDAATGRTDTFALAGLFNRRRGVEGRDRDWLLPLYLRDEANGLFMTPLWAHQRDDAGAPLWRAVPPLHPYQPYPLLQRGHVLRLDTPPGPVHRLRGYEAGARPGPRRAMLRLHDYRWGHSPD